MYKNGDVIINYRRSRVYLYDENNKQHLKDFFSCRIASLQEKQDFLKLNVQECKLKDLNIKREWKNRQKLNELETKNIFLEKLNQLITKELKK